MNLLHTAAFALEPGESTVSEARIHWFFFLTRLLPYAFLAVLPLFIPPVLRLAPQFSALALDYASPLARLALGAWWLLLWTAAFNTFTKMFLNLWVLTDRRIAEVKQPGYFHREVSSLMLGRVQDVTVDVEGVIPSLLGIGDINVQTAGEEERFTMRHVPHPERLRDDILAHVARAPAATGL